MSFRENNALVERGGIKPSVAYANLQNEVKRSYPEDNVEALKALPSRKSTLQTFTRKRQSAKPPDFDPLDPPENTYVSFTRCYLLLTFLFQASTLTRNGQQTLLLRAYSQVQPPFMYLADQINLESLHAAPILMADGTFAYNPKETYRVEYKVGDETMRTSGQTYTLHAVYPDLPDRQGSYLCGEIYTSLLPLCFNFQELLSCLTRLRRHTFNCSRKSAKH